MSKNVKTLEARVVVESDDINELGDVEEAIASAVRSNANIEESNVSYSFDIGEVKETTHNIQSI